MTDHDITPDGSVASVFITTEPDVPPEPLVFESDNSVAKAEAKAALLAALPEGAITPEQMDLLFGSTPIAPTEGQG